MKTALRRAANALHLSATEENAVRSAFGPEHPLARAIVRQRTVALQLVATTIAVSLGVAGILQGAAGARLVLAAAGSVGLLLGLYARSTRTSVRERADAIIAEGRDADGVAVLALERRRLASRDQRERLARSLERLLRDAERWFEVHPSFRLPREIRLLQFVAPEVRDVVALLRTDAAPIQGVAATATFVHDQASPLFAGDVEALRSELGRLCRLLAPTEREQRLAA
jgi:hypothetical protein